MGPAWGQVVPSWSQVRQKLDVGAKRVQVGPKLGRCWPKLTPSGTDVGAMLHRNGAFGRCCANLKNV